MDHHVTDDPACAEVKAGEQQPQDDTQQVDSTAADDGAPWLWVVVMVVLYIALLVFLFSRIELGRDANPPPPQATTLTAPTTSSTASLAPSSTPTASSTGSLNPTPNKLRHRVQRRVHFP